VTAFVLPALPPLAALAKLLVSLVGIVGVTAGLLWGCGFLVARPLLPRRYRPLLPFIAPFLGFSLVSAVAHYAGAAGMPLRSVLWLPVALAGAGWAVVLLDRRRRRFPRSSAPALAICLLAFFLAVGPLLVLGYLTTLGGTIDGVSYAVRSEYLQGAPPSLPDIAAGKPYLGWIRSQIEFLRLGDVYLVGLLGLLTGKRSYELLTVVPALFYALTAGSVYVLARAALGFRRRAALLAAALVGANSLLLWPVYDNFLSQAVALGFLPLVLAFGIEAQRRPAWRPAVLFAILFSGLVSAYPLFALRALAPVLLFWGLAWLWRPGEPRGRALGRAALWWLGALAAAVLFNAFAFTRSAAELELMSNPATRGPGNILVFPPPVEVFGLIAHAAAAYGDDWRWVPVPVLYTAGLALAALAAYGWWRLRPRARLATAALLVTSAALVAQQRWGVPYPYGYFKILTTVVAEVMLLVAAGFAALGQGRRKLRPQAAVPPRPQPRFQAKKARAHNPPKRGAKKARRHRGGSGGARVPPSLDWTVLRRWLAGGAALLLLALNLKNSLWTQSYVLQSALLLDQDLIDMGRAAAKVEPDDWVLLDMKAGLRQHWLGYLVRERKIRYREPLWMGDVDTPGAANAFFRYAVVEKELDEERRRATLDEPWYEPAAFSRLAGNGRYELRERRDPVIARLPWDRPWRAGEQLALTLSDATFSAQLGQEVKTGGVGAGRSSTLQVHLYSLDPASRIEIAGLGGPDGPGSPLPLGPGGWLLDIDLGCAAGRRIGIDHTAGEVILADVQILRTVTGRPGVCLEKAPLPTGVAYLEQDDLGDGRIRLRAAVLRPEKAGERAYRLGLHVIEVAQGKLFGVWSLDFPPQERVQHGSMELDLRDRSARGTMDGHPTALEAGNFALDTGSFEVDAVWWQFNPLEQLQVEGMLWFQRDGKGAARVTRALPAARLEILGGS